MNPLQYMAFVPLAFVAALRRSERRVIARLLDAGANTAERAILLDTQRPLSGFTRQRLERAEVLRPAGNDRYYLNVGGYEAFRARRRKRAMVMAALLLIGVAILYFRGDFS
jgi:hypothetical protein